MSASIIREGDALVSEEYTRSNATGDFALTVFKRLDPGVYTFTLRVTDEGGAKSSESSPRIISVRSKFIFSLISIVLEYLSAAILVSVALGALVVAGAYLWFRVTYVVQRMRREAQGAERASAKVFKLLRENIATHIARLKVVRRKLTDEEVEFLEQFKEELGEVEEVIVKKIQDISDRPR